MGRITIKKCFKYTAAICICILCAFGIALLWENIENSAQPNNMSDIPQPPDEITTEPVLTIEPVNAGVENSPVDQPISRIDADNQQQSIQTPSTEKLTPIQVTDIVLGENSVTLANGKEAKVRIRMVEGTHFPADTPTNVPHWLGSGLIEVYIEDKLAFYDDWNISCDDVFELSFRDYNQDGNPEFCYQGIKSDGPNSIFTVHTILSDGRVEQLPVERRFTSVNDQAWTQRAVTEDWFHDKADSYDEIQTGWYERKEGADHELPFNYWEDSNPTMIRGRQSPTLYQPDVGVIGVVHHPIGASYYISHYQWDGRAFVCTDIWFSTDYRDIDAEIYLAGTR